MRIKVLLLFDTWFGRRDYVGAVGNRSESDNGRYVTCVRQAVQNPAAFAIFKRDPRYQNILEHASRKQGADYLALLRENSPSYFGKMSLIKQNDIVGGATVFDFEGVGKISPSTLRYAKVASDLHNLFGESIGPLVAEIGVGYGGQLLVADKLLHYGRWDLFDLPPVLGLASKYLECHTLSGAYRLVTVNQHEGAVKYDLVISNYAFSELPSQLQRTYVSKVLSRSRRGYLTMNSGTTESDFQRDKLPLDALRELLPAFRILKEKPLTHPGNYIIVWGGQ